MLSQQDQEIRRNVPDPSFAGGSHLCGSGTGNETIVPRDIKSMLPSLVYYNYNIYIYT